MVAVWLFEGDFTDSAGSNDLTYIAGSGATPTVPATTPTPVFDGVNYKEGAQAGHFVEASNQYTKCDTGSTCAALKLGTAFSIGGWSRRTTINTNARWRMTGIFSVRGFDTFTAAGNHHTQCRVGTSGSVAASADDALDTFLHWACTQDNATTTLQAYANGTVSGTADTSSTLDAQTSGNFYVGSNFTTTDWDGEFDEFYVDDVAHTAAQTCRIANCQIDGTLCACDGMSPANYATCSIDADCQFATARCVSGLCQGRGVGLCLGGANIGDACEKANEGTKCPASTCTICGLTACNAAAP